MGSKIYEDRKPRYRVILLQTHNVKRLYLLKGMPYFHNSFTVLKLIHYDLVSDFSTGLCVLHIYTILQTGRHRLNTILNMCCLSAWTFSEHCHIHTCRKKVTMPYFQFGYWAIG